MNIYNAIMAAADQIESHPKDFNFMSVKVPSPGSCGTPGCALGWITAFCEKPVTVHGYLGICGSIKQLRVGYAGEFYERMDSCETWWERVLMLSWRDSAERCAKTMRKYAAKYHAPKAPAITGIPDSVRAIFSDLKAAPDSLADMAGAPSVGR